MHAEQQPSSRRLAVLQLGMAPERIHFLKFLLEGYDGMAILSTLNRDQGLVELKYPAELRPDLMALLRSTATQTGIEQLPD